MKTVTFLDERFDVPEWANYITHDLDHAGAVIAWEKKPVFANAIWSCDTKDWINPGERVCVGHVDVCGQIAKI